MDSKNWLHVLLIWGPILAGVGAFFAISRMGRGKKQAGVNDLREEKKHDEN